MRPRREDDEQASNDPGSHRAGSSRLGNGRGHGGALAQSESDAEPYTAGRTPWGDPDLQGIWSPGYILTPLERPDEFAEQEFLTDDDVAALEERANVRRRDQRAEAGSVADVEGAYNEAFTGRGKEVIQTRRTSLIIDPPDGKIPHTDAGKAAVAAARQKMMTEDADNPEESP